MAYRIPLPEGGRSASLDIIEPSTTAVQRFIRREGLGAYEPPTAAAMLTLCEASDPGFVVYDVGANMGLYGALAASMFAPAAVHSFEPAPASAQVAARIGRRNGLAMTVHQMAVSDQVGTAALHLSPVSDASNSLVEGFRVTDDRIDVDTVTIDAMVERSGDHPDIIKIDVETHERAVLDGARVTIERDRPALIVEVLRRRGHDHGDEISEFFAGRGYRCFELSAEPDWQAHDRVRGSGTTDRDWLLLPGELPADLPERWTTWIDRLSVCTADRNPRVPVTARIGAAYRRGGLREVVATVDRHRRSHRRG
jgi:FkbM family methyltransferase